MRLALVVLKKDARRTMKLWHNHSFGAVNHEGAGRRHQWNFAHINLLFANFLDDRFVWRFAIKQYETYLCCQRPDATGYSERIRAAQTHYSTQSEKWTETPPAAQPACAAQAQHPLARNH